MKSSGLSRLWQVLLYTAILMVVGAIVGGKLANHHKSHFSDAYLYANGLRAFEAGQDAYVGPEEATTGFIYPPVVLEAAAGLGRLLPHVLLWRTYLSLLLACIFITPWLLAKIVGASHWFSPLVSAVIFVLEPCLYSVYTALSGNVNVLLVTGILASAISVIAGGSWAAFCAVVALAGVVKPLFLVYLLLPCLVAERQAGKAAAALAATAGTYATQALFMPRLCAGWRESMRISLVERSDYGFGIFGFLHEHTYTRLAFMQWTGSMVAHSLVVGVLVWLFWKGKPLRHQAGLSTLWVPAVVVLCFLANPRPLSYDLYAGWPLAVFVVVEWLRTAARRERILVAAGLTLFLSALAVEDPSMFAAGIFFAALLLVLARIGQIKRTPAGSAPCGSQYSLQTAIPL